MISICFSRWSAVLPTSNMLVRLVVRLALLPFVVAISYEFNRLVGRHDNWLTRILTAPGMWFQNFTTNEPDDSMLEVGIEALKLVLPDEAGPTDGKEVRRPVSAGPAGSAAHRR